MSDDNVTRIYGGDDGDEEFTVDHDDDGDGYSDSTELVEWTPPLPAVRPAPASIVDARLIADKEGRRDWRERNQGALELRTKALAYHGLRLPFYGAKYTTFAGSGLGIVCSRIWHWMRDTVSLDMHAALAVDPLVPTDAKIVRSIQIRESRFKRVRITYPLMVILVIFMALIIRWGIIHHIWWSLLAGTVAAIILGFVGSRPGEVIQPLDIPMEFSLSTDLVLEAFINATITKPERPVVVRPPGPLRQGTGYFVLVVLPGGMTFDDDVKPKARRLASGLHVARARLDFDLMEEDDEAAFGIYVSDVHPSKMPVPAWPLLTVTSWDIWQSVPVGPNLRGELEMLNVIFTSVLVGAAPRMGKSWTIRLPFLAGALDPTVQQDIFDFKGGGDWSMWDGIAGVLREGPSDENVEALRDYLRDDLWPDVQRRSATLKSLGTARAPGAKVTPSLSADPTLGLHIRMFMVDECHIATEHPEYGEEICDLLRKVTAQAPAGGVVAALATQKPDAKSVPSVISANMNTRIAGRCLTHHASAAILGTAAKSQGWEAETIGRKQKGTVIMLGAGDDAGASNDGAQIRACEVDGVMAEEICRRAKALRADRAVTVTAQAEDIPQPKAVPPIVAAALRHWPRNPFNANCHQDVLAGLMHMDQVDLGRSMREIGIGADPVRMKRPGEEKTEVARGYRLADLEAVTG